jgi:hypothetical protein
MNAKEYQNAAGKEAARKVVAMAGTTWRYWQHFVTGHKRPGPDLARLLIDASEQVTPGTVMTLDALLVPIDKLRTRSRKSS